MKKIIALLLSLTMMLGLSVPAFAAQTSSDSGSMIVSYRVSSSYLINLPDLTCTSDSNKFTFTADYVHIESGKTLNISVDTSKTLEDDTFYLTNTTDNSKMECKVYVEPYNKTTAGSAHYLSASDPLLASFAAETTKPSRYGSLTLTPMVTSNTTVGYYMGYIYYIITVE